MCVRVSVTSISSLSRIKKYLLVSTSFLPADGLELETWTVGVRSNETESISRFLSNMVGGSVDQLVSQSVSQSVSQNHIIHNKRRTYFAPTAKATMDDWFRVKKYRPFGWTVSHGRRSLSSWKPAANRRCLH